MEFGLSLPGRGPLAGLDVVLRIAEKADSLRYSSLFVTDHVVMPVSSAKSVYPYTTSGQFPGGLAQDYLEPLVLLSHLAHATARVRLGVSVLVVPYRNPLLAAKMLATTDVLSRGRVILGAGVGWLREEFEALGAPPFEERGSVTDEYLKLMRAAWTTDPVLFEGKYYTVRNIHDLPKPVQRTAIPRGKRSKAAAGDRPLFQGTADEVAADIRRYQALGVSHFVFDHTVQELRAVLSNMERFANDVRPKVSRARRK